MNLLLDTHLLLWSAGLPDRLSVAARSLILADEHELMFSAASIWEITIKRGLGRSDFLVDPALLRRGLLENGYSELAITGRHALAVDRLPQLHRDPFDRILVAQAFEESVLLLTSDAQVARYPGPVRLV